MNSFWLLHNSNFHRYPEQSELFKYAAFYREFGVGHCLLFASPFIGFTNVFLGIFFGNE